MKPFFSASTLASAATVARIETLEAKIYSDNPMSKRERTKLEASLKFLDRRKSDQAHRALARMRARKIVSIVSVSAPINSVPRAPRARHGEGSRSSAASGDGNSNSDPEPDPEPARPLLQDYLQLFDSASLAVALCLSKKTIQNLYSSTPWLLPPAIHIPGARGPRWTVAAVQAWLSDRPLHSAKTAPQAASRKVGRPRIALAGIARSAGKVGAA